ncbi:DUF1643 domain-containing protein [Alcanivorax sp.]|uniref:DUF1643 domain-containing protein n=1 Tax=Alcanivorax sp. TaxID=1872427 RepID=UPI003BA8FDE6
MEIQKHAHMSECGTYRYFLTRRWEPGSQALLFIMLNPSTADHREDDPTIRRCVGFARREGYGAITVMNLYSFRATSPKNMLAAADPVGPQTDSYLLTARNYFDRAICAWGANADRDRVAEVVEILTPGMELFCLGTTKAGHPRHPLYVKGDQKLVPWPTPPARKSDG